MDDMDLVRLLVKGARQEGREEAHAAVNLIHDCREAEATIDKQGRRVLELEAEIEQWSRSGVAGLRARVVELEARAQQAEARLKSTCHHYAEVRRELERVQGERDALEAEVDRLTHRLARLPWTSTEGMYEDAELGRLVRAMPCNSDLRHTGTGWKVWDAKGPVSFGFASPEEALRAAGVTAEHRAEEEGGGGGGAVEEEQAEEREGVRS